MSPGVDQFDLLAVGELNPDLILTGIHDNEPRLGVEQEFGGYRLTLGSSTAICCVLTQRLGLRTAMSACVGDDDYGRFCRQALETERVDTRMVVTQAGVETGLTVCLPYPSDRLLMTCKGAMALDPSAALSDELLRTARHLHVGSFFLQTALRPRLAGLFARARSYELTTSLDTGWDPDQNWLDDDLRAVLAQTSILLPNAMEFERLSGETDVARGVASLRALGVGAVVLKRGAAGAFYAGPDDAVGHSGFEISPRDTTGAGDAFNAGYLMSMLKGAPVADRLAFGNACGALTASSVGGTGGVFSADQVHAFIAERATAG